MKRTGQISVELLFLSALVVTLIGGFVSLASSFLQISVREQNKLQAFQIAEAGVEYYRWHLAHAPLDFTDGTGNPGPYVHPYYNKDGTQIGQFKLTITPPGTGSTIVTITSEGDVLADSSVKKLITVKFGKPSFVKFAVASNDNIRFGAGTETFGQIFSNGGIHFDGLAHNIVESAKQTYTDPDPGGGGLSFGVHTQVAPADPSPPAPVPSRPDVFQAGRQFPLPALDFAQFTQTLASLKTQAQASGTYFGASGGSGYEFDLATSSIFSLYKVTGLKAPPNNCTSGATGWGTWSVNTKTLVATGTIPNVGVFFFEDDLWIKGQINGKRLTIAAGRFPDNASTRANITINSSTLYTNYDGTDAIGYIAQNNFNVGLFSDNILRIDGAIVAQNGRAGRYFYSSANCGANVTRSTLTLYGSIISNVRYGFAYTDGTGYTTRNLIYDANLLFGPPPSFPLTTDQYTLISWQETQ